MTTFTKVRNEDATISIDPRRKLYEISPYVYGHFIEHIGRGIYGGLYDPESPQADENGFRKDVLGALRDELHIPVMRYPGGNFVQNYHWEDGVGPKEKRKARPELAWGTIESNQFGTDEFMAWCKACDTEPYLCLNMGSGTLEEALNWVEYCNGSGNTYYANLRRQNGHDEPYNVKYWALGNEVWGEWQVGTTTAEDYAARAVQWAKAIRLLDPSVQLVVCALNGFTDWDRTVVAATLPFVDMVSVHQYTASLQHLPNATSPLHCERAIEMTAALIDLAAIRHDLLPFHAPPGHHPSVGDWKPPHKPRICFDEWNVWDPQRAPGHEGSRMRFSLSDALAVGVWLNVFVRQARHVGMACLAQSVNVIAPLVTDEAGPGTMRKQAIWWPLLLASRYLRGCTVGVHLACGVWDGDGEGAGVEGKGDEWIGYGAPTSPAWLRGVTDTPWLDVACAVDDGGGVSLSVVNIHPSQDIEVTIEGMAGGAKVYEVNVDKKYGDGKDALMDPSGKGVEMREREWDGKKGKFKFSRHSYTLVRWGSLEESVMV